MGILDSSDAFASKKPEQMASRPSMAGPAFQAMSSPKKQREGMSQATAKNLNYPPFAFAPAVAQSIASQEYYSKEIEDEDDISYGVVAFSCFLSLALGFGLGYGT